MLNDVLIGIETQTRLEWQSAMVSSLPKLGNESRLCKIIVLKISRYSTVKYTIEYMYKFIALRSEFCTFLVWPKPVCGIVAVKMSRH